MSRHGSPRSAGRFDAVRLMAETARSGNAFVKGVGGTRHAPSFFLLRECRGENAGESGDGLPA